MVRFLKNKRNIIHLKLLLLPGMILFLYAFSEQRNCKRYLTDTPIVFNNPECPLITEQTVNKLLIQNKGSFQNISKSVLDLNSLEGSLLSNDFIRDANVYVSVNGSVGVEVQQKKPLGRVVGVSSFYIDEKGAKMPVSPNFSARVPLVTGKVGKNNQSDLYFLLTQINEDEFYKKQIQSIAIEGNKFMLRIRTYSFVIELGTVNHCNRKLKNFKAFYKKALKDNTINKYSKVNLQIASQVVCTKK